jgi:LuxR family maltose regulon positive regulatory protein
MFDLGDRAAGLAELQQARSDFGANQTSPHHCAAMTMLEFRVALQLGGTPRRPAPSWAG